MKLTEKINDLLNEVKIKKLEIIDKKMGRGKFDLVSPMQDSDFEKSKKWVGYDIPYGYGIKGSAVIYKRNLEPKKSLTVKKDGFGKWLVFEYNYFGKKDKKEFGGYTGWTGFDGSAVIKEDGWSTPEEAMDQADAYYSLK